MSTYNVTAITTFIALSLGGGGGGREWGEWGTED